MQLFRAFFVLFSVFVCLSCTKNQSIDHSSFQACLGAEKESKQGQIRYFDGVSLFVEGCDFVVGSIDLEIQDDARVLLFANIDIDGSSGFQYVDIEFSGELQRNGKILISDITKAAIAKHSKFPPDDGKLCRQLNLPVENCADL